MSCVVVIREPGRVVLGCDARVASMPGASAGLIEREDAGPGEPGSGIVIGYAGSDAARRALLADDCVWPRAGRVRAELRGRGAPRGGVWYAVDRALFLRDRGELRDGTELVVTDGREVVVIDRHGCVGDDVRARFARAIGPGSAEARGALCALRDGGTTIDAESQALHALDAARRWHGYLGDDRQRVVMAVEAEGGRRG